MRASLVTGFCAAVLIGFGLGGMATSRADVPDSVKITGVVQDWSVDRGYMVVEGVRYEFGLDFVVLTEQGQPLSAASVGIGDRVGFWTRDGTVDTVMLVSNGTLQ